MLWVKIPSFSYFDLDVQKREFPGEWLVRLTGHYDKVVIAYTDASGKTFQEDARGFYFFKTESASIEFERQDSKGKVSVIADIDVVWHVGGSSSIRLQAKLTPLDIQEIDHELAGQDLLVHWAAIGFGFLEESDARRFTQSIVKIDCSNYKRQTFSREQFVKRILEPMDRFRREFVEITAPLPESISKVPKELEVFATLLKDRSGFLQEALKKVASSTTSREYAEAIGDVRRALGAMEKQLKQIKDAMAEKLFIDMGILTGEGAMDQSKAVISQLLNILGSLEGLASGLGIHLETKEAMPKSYVSNPDYCDARYIVLASMLTLSYLTERLEFLTRRNV